ncbi:MAG: polysaccharide biosynthesis/export family protein [Rickettsiales bacterium]|nr:polysaccharide biosynthesis/export family protein [Rickettsiales bacterium]
MKIQHYIKNSLWLICTLLIASCGFETVKLPSSDQEITYNVAPIDEKLQVTVDTPFMEDAAPATKSKKNVPYDYIVGAGDSLLINLYLVSSDGSSGLTRIIPQAPALPSENMFLVGADGTLTVPYAGKMNVDGMPFGQVKNKLRQSFRKYFLDPQLEMTMANFSSSRVLVSGELTKPQEVTLSHRPLTVMDAITTAGGALPTADLRNAKITRANGKAEGIDVAAIIYEGAADNNKILLAGDTLHIPRNHANQIYVMGEVFDPKTLTMHPTGMNLTEALSAVRGLNPRTAKPSTIYVMREYAARSEGKRDVSVYHLDASNPKSYVYGSQFKLQPQDVVYIGSQTITDWSRFITQLLPGGIAGLVQPAPYVLN